MRLQHRAPGVWFWVPTRLRHRIALVVIITKSAATKSAEPSKTFAESFSSITSKIAETWTKQARPVVVAPTAVISASITWAAIIKAAKTSATGH